MYSHVACDVMKERTLYLLKPSSLIWHLMPYLFLSMINLPRYFKEECCSLEAKGMVSMCTEYYLVLACPGKSVAESMTVSTWP